MRFCGKVLKQFCNDFQHKKGKEFSENLRQNLVEIKKFTCKEKERFCNRIPDGFKKIFSVDDHSEKLFDVGSHGLDEPGYAGETYGKEELMEIFKSIFEKNDAKDHFDLLWSKAKKSEKEQNVPLENS